MRLSPRCHRKASSSAASSATEVFGSSGWERKAAAYPANRSDPPPSQPKRGRYKDALPPAPLTSETLQQQSVSCQFPSVPPSVCSAQSSQVTSMASRHEVGVQMPSMRGSSHGTASRQSSRGSSSYPTWQATTDAYAQSLPSGPALSTASSGQDYVAIAEGTQVYRGGLWHRKSQLGLDSTMDYRGDRQEYASDSDDQSDTFADSTSSNQKRASRGVSDSVVGDSRCEDGSDMMHERILDRSRGASDVYSGTGQSSNDFHYGAGDTTHRNQHMDSSHTRRSPPSCRSSQGDEFERRPPSSHDDEPPSDEDAFSDSSVNISRSRRNSRPSSSCHSSAKRGDRDMCPFEDESETFGSETFHTYVTQPSLNHTHMEMESHGQSKGSLQHSKSGASAVSDYTTSEQDRALSYASTSGNHKKRVTIGGAESFSAPSYGDSMSRSRTTEEITSEDEGVSVRTTERFRRAKDSVAVTRDRLNNSNDTDRFPHNGDSRTCSSRDHSDAESDGSEVFNGAGHSIRSSVARRAGDYNSDDDSSVPASGGSVTRNEPEHEDITLEGATSTYEENDPYSHTYNRAICRFTTPTHISCVGLAQAAVAPHLAERSDYQDMLRGGFCLAGREASRVALLIEHSDRIKRDMQGSYHQRVASSVELPGIIKGLAEEFIMYTHGVLSQPTMPIATDEDGLPVALVLLVQLVECLDLVSFNSPSEVPVMSQAIGDLLNPGNLMEYCLKTLNMGLRSDIDEVFTKELRLHAVMALHILLSWMPAPGVRNPADALLAFQGHDALLNHCNEVSMEQDTTLSDSQRGIECSCRLALALGALQLGLDSNSSKIQLLRSGGSMNSRRSSQGSLLGSSYRRSRSSIGCDGMQSDALAMLAFRTLEGTPLPQAVRSANDDFANDAWAATDAVIAGTIGLLASISDLPNAAVPGAARESFGPSIERLLAARPLRLPVVQALRSLVSGRKPPGKIRSWLGGGNTLGNELYQACAVARIPDLVISGARLMLQESDSNLSMELKRRDISWEDEAKLVRDRMSLMCDIFGHVEAIVMGLSRQRPQKLDELMVDLDSSCSRRRSDGDDSSVSNGSRTLLSKLGSLRQDIRGRGVKSSKRL